MPEEDIAEYVYISSWT